MLYPKAIWIVAMDAVRHARRRGRCRQAAMHRGKVAWRAEVMWLVTLGLVG